MPADLRTQSELDVLTAIERGEVVTQMALTKRVGVSIGLINALLKRGVLKGYVKARQAPYKRYAYYLTPKGFGEKSRLVAEYLDSSLRFYRKSRTQYAEIMALAHQMGMARLVLVGGGELAEIAILAAWGENVQILAVIDQTTAQERRYGVPVVALLSEVGPIDGAVITDARHPQRTYEELAKILPDSSILAPELLRVTRDHGALLAAAQRAEEVR